MKEDKLKQFGDLGLVKDNLYVIGKTQFIFRVSDAEIVSLVENLGSMVDAGIPLVESLDMVRDLTTNRLMKDILYIARKQVEAGKPLHYAFSFFDDVFDPVFLSVVKSGEISGTLADALMYLSKEIGSRNDLKQRLISIMIYPALISLVLLGVIVFMLVAVIPKLEELYTETGQELPFLTLAMLTASKFMTSIWAVVALGVIFLAVVVFTLIFRTPAGKKFVHTQVLKIPLFSNLIKQTILQRIARTFSLTLKSGVPILESLVIVGETTGNIVYGDGIKKLSKSLESGQSISKSMMGDNVLYPKIFVPLFVRIVAVGEKTGNLAESLDKLSDIYYTKVIKQIRTISSFMEPVLLIIIGLVVGVLTLAVTLPIYQLPNVINVN